MAAMLLAALPRALLGLATTLALTACAGVAIENPRAAPASSAIAEQAAMRPLAALVEQVSIPNESFTLANGLTSFFY